MIAEVFAVIIVAMVLRILALVTKTAGISCGDGCCNGGENSGNCLDDCPTTCGDGYCVGVEESCLCP